MSKPREWWLVIGKLGRELCTRHVTYKAAASELVRMGGAEVVHVREVKPKRKGKRWATQPETI